MPEPEVPDADLRRDDPVPDASDTPDAQDPDKGPEPDGAAGEDHGEGAEGHAEKAPLTGLDKRLGQLYARTKRAEAELQQEREARARLEGQLDATKVQDKKPEPRLTWTQLQAGIQDGKITEVQAREYDRESIKQELLDEQNKRFDRELSVRTRATTVQAQLTEYKQTVPEILTVGSPERVKLEKEFSYLVSMGYDANDPRTDLMALRTTFGDVKVAKDRREAKTTIPERETMQDIQGQNKPKPDPKDPLKTITGEQKKYYQRMIDQGQYKGWAEVREELAFVPPR